VIRRAGLVLVTLLAACAAAHAPDPPAPATTPAPADTAVLTQKNEPTRTGWNTHETVLTQHSVDAAHFGRRITYPVDGAVYAQPLFVPGLGGSHNAVIVATEHDSVYAFDADATGPARAPLWHRSLLPAGATPVSAAHDVTCAAISPEVGVTGTPVIDPATGTLYVVATAKERDGIRYRIYGLNLADGRDRTAPVTIGAPAFVPRYEQQRMGLLLLNGVVYAAFASYCDEDPSHGFILGFRAGDLARVSVYTDSPQPGSSGLRPGGGGLWESETGLTADAAGSIYVVTGNGPFNLDTPGGGNAGNSLVRLVPDGDTLRVADYFSPYHQECLNDHDQDLGSGGPLLLPALDEVLFIGKEGRIYVTRMDRLGGHRPLDRPCTAARAGSGVDPIVQESAEQVVDGGVFGSETWWGPYVYTAGVTDHLKAWRLSGGKLAIPAAMQAAPELSYPGGVPVISSNGTVPGTAILWIVGEEDSGPVLRAYDPLDLSHELWHSDRDRDRLTSYCNFTVPTVAAGRVFVGTRDSVAVFGPLTGTAGGP
jgi:hypothetical protein